MLKRYELHPGDCRDTMRAMPENSIDAVVCDPPYGLSKEPDVAEVMRHWLAGDDYQHTGSGFMGKSWDSFVPGPAVWREAYRVLKPGGHLVAFFGTRTYDLGVMALRLAGFEVRDQLAWVYGSGFPKSHDVSKGIDKAAGVERTKVRFDANEVRNPKAAGNGTDGTVGATRPWIEKALERGFHEKDSNTPATPEAEQWQGWGTALKPAFEPIVLARKPLSEKTVAANVLRWGTGAINVDACRVPHDEECRVMAPSRANIESPSDKHRQAGRRVETLELKPGGRWPANFTHDGSDEATAPLGEAARFYYCPKASKADRNRGLDDPTAQPSAASEFRPNHADKAANGEDGNPYGRFKPIKNFHPTVKPTALMQWLCRMVTQPGGVVLDPFMGSGSTGVACMLEGFQFIGCEMTEEYLPIAKARISDACGGLFDV